MIDVAQLTQTIDVDGWAPCDPPPWLIDSWRDGRRFSTDLFAWHDTAGPLPLRSRVAGAHDLYHDLLLRHAESSTPALVWFAGATRRSLSFAELARLTTARAEAWRRAGAEPGQELALVRSFGPELVLSLLAAFKLGLVTTLVPPAGRRLARARLAALAPALADIDELQRGLLPPATLRLPLSTDERLPPLVERAQPNKADAPLLRLYDPTLLPHEQPRPLTAAALLSSALCDGALALGLRPGDALAAPDVAPGREPSLLLAALASGATFVHLTLEACRQSPALLGSQWFKSVIVSPRLRELVCRQPLPLGARWHAWFRDPLQSTQLDPWQRFIEAAALHSTYAGNLRWEAAAGGLTLFSPRRRGQAHCDVWPAAGVTWSLGDLLQPALPTSAGPGRLLVSPPGAAEPEPTVAIVLPRGRGWLSGGALPACPGGRRFAAADAVAVAGALPGCRAAVALVDPRSDGEPARFLLLTFGSAGVQEIERALIDELGADELPDEIIASPLLPRRDESGAVDARWCHHQLRSGGLARKAQDELFRLLSRLREEVVPLAKESA